MTTTEFRKTTNQISNLFVPNEIIQSNPEVTEKYRKLPNLFITIQIIVQNQAGGVNYTLFQPSPVWAFKQNHDETHGPI